MRVTLKLETPQSLTAVGMPAGQLAIGFSRIADHRTATVGLRRTGVRRLQGAFDVMLLEKRLERERRG